jgi:flavin reductase (DIM6/NTAB) family NADH-FMN oxidoreductase RutF
MSTISSEGVCNLAPMSYFNMVSHNPPTIMVSVMASATNSNGLKGTYLLGCAQAKVDIVDTAKNIQDTKEFCCSIISEPFMEAASYTSIDSPPGIEEWALAGLTKRASS